MALLNLCAGLVPQGQIRVVINDLIPECTVPLPCGFVALRRYFNVIKQHFQCFICVLGQEVDGFCVCAADNNKTTKEVPSLSQP